MSRFVLYMSLMSAFRLGACAQTNLIYNGSFEEYHACPTGNDLNNGQLEKAKGWWKPTLGTSDYFNRCAVATVGVPNNFWGFQEPYHGDAYVGLVPTEWNTHGLYGGFEYIEGRLIEPLKKCHEYKFTMYVSLAEGATHAVGRLGALFTQNQINNDLNYNVIDQSPQVFNQSIVTDSLGWYKISGVFVAQGNEEYITVGYFFPSVENDTLFIQDYLLGLFVPYYYVDSISLYEIGQLKEECIYISLPNIFTPNLDGVNDLIDISQYLHMDPRVTIYNRWGNKLVILDKGNPAWDGKAYGNSCPDGVYYYILEFGNNKIKQSGVIHLVR